MNMAQTADGNRDGGIAFHIQNQDGVSIRLIFSEKPNSEAPALISELLRNSYFNRLSSESRCEQ